MKEGDKTIMPMGKHKGKEFGEIPASYFVWFLEQDWAKKWPTVYRYAIKNEQQLIQEKQSEQFRREA